MAFSKIVLKELNPELTLQIAEKSRVVAETLKLELLKHSKIDAFSQDLVVKQEIVNFFSNCVLCEFASLQSAVV